MSLLNQIERRCGNWGIPGLLRVVAILQVVVFVLLLARPQFAGMLTLDIEKINEGEFWRVLSFCVLPVGGVITTIFNVMLLFWAGDALEAGWGTFRLNLYFFSTVAMMVVAEAVSPGFGNTGPWLLSLLIFLAFATMFPSAVLNLYGVLPVQAKWLGWLDFGYLVYLFWAAPDFRGALVLALLPFLIFAVPGFVRQLRHGAKVNVRRAEFTAAKKPETDFFHKCTVCGRTDVSNPELVFRVMDDDTERCQDHLPGKA